MINFFLIIVNNLMNIRAFYIAKYDENPKAIAMPRKG